MAVAGIVGGLQAFTFIELPVADQVRCRRLLRVVHLSLCIGAAACLVPECKLVDGTCHLLAHSQCAVALIGHDVLVSEQHRLCVILGKHGVQHAAVLIGLIVQRQEHPLVRRDSLSRGIGLLTNLHHEVTAGIGANVHLLGTIAVAQQGASTREFHPHIHGEVLIRQVDVGLGLGGTFRCLAVQCHAMCHLLAVQGCRDLEVVCLGEHALADILVEGQADLVASIQHTVARVGVAEQLWLLHILDHRYYVALLRNLIVAIGRSRLGAEQIGAIHVVLHRELYGDDAALGQRLAVGCCILVVYVILLSGYRRPVDVALTFILYAYGLQVLVVGVVVAYAQRQYIAHAGVQHVLVGHQRHVGTAGHEVGSDIHHRLQVALAVALQRKADVLVVIYVSVVLLQRQRDGQCLTALHDEGVAIAQRACREAQLGAVRVGIFHEFEVELAVAVRLAHVLQLQVEDGLAAARHIAQYVLGAHNAQLRVFHLHRGSTDACAGLVVFRHRLILIGA